MAPGIVDPNSTAVQAIVAAINQVCTAVCFRIEISAVEPHAVTPTALQVYVNEDKAEFNFTDEKGASHTFKLPGLKTTILESDHETIDCTTGAASTFVTAVAGFAQGPGGATLEPPLIGKRRAARKPLKK
jgi:hypothetical protein